MFHPPSSQSSPGVEKCCTCCTSFFRRISRRNRGTKECKWKPCFVVAEHVPRKIWKMDRFIFLCFLTFPNCTSTHVSTTSQVWKTNRFLRFLLLRRPYFSARLFPQVLKWDGNNAQNALNIFEKIVLCLTRGQASGVHVQNNVENSNNHIVYVTSPLENAGNLKLKYDLIQGYVQGCALEKGVIYGQPCQV